MCACLLFVNAFGTGVGEQTATVRCQNRVAKRGTKMKAASNEAK